MVLRATSSVLNTSRDADFPISLGSPFQSLIILPCEKILPDVHPKHSLMPETPQSAETILCFGSVLAHWGYF